MAATRVLTGVALAAIAACGAAVAPPAGARQPRVKPVQQLAVLLTAHRVVAAPGARPRRVGGVRAWRPITGSRTVLPVVRSTTRDGMR
jgi:hypothetical protein